MTNRILFIPLFFIAVSCAPTNWLDMDIITPCEFSFPDTGRIAVLNASYSPSAIHIDKNLMSKLPAKEQLIFDTLIVTNLFNGLFSVFEESPNEYLQSADYYEIRTNDTTNFLFPLLEEEVSYLSKSYSARFIVAMEYYSFNFSKNTEFNEWSGWESKLSVPYQILWRIYSNDGKMLDQYISEDTLYWYENIDTNLPIPEIPDALRETFFLAGEKFGKHISPFWFSISRPYFQIYSFGEDISLERNKLIELASSDKKTPAFKACYNLAVLNESDDRLTEAIEWLEKCKTIRKSEYTDFYLKKLNTRLETREKLDIQSGFK